MELLRWLVKVFLPDFEIIHKDWYPYFKNFSVELSKMFLQCTQKNYPFVICLKEFYKNSFWGNK